MVAEPELRAPHSPVIAPMAHQDLHARVLPYLLRSLPPQTPHPTHVLDLGAGTGSMSQLMVQAGYRVAACDLAPELFQLPDVECRRADLGERLPYDDASLEGIVCLEVLEHLDGHLPLFAEINRLLQPGGVFLFSTPNVMSIKSRLSFLNTGFPHSFYPLNEQVLTPQEWHISGFSPDRYRFAFSQAGLQLEEIGCDRWSRTSLCWSWLIPWIKLQSWWHHGHAPGATLNNSWAALLGPGLIVHKDGSLQKTIAFRGPDLDSATDSELLSVR